MLMLWPGDLVLAFWDVLLTLLLACSIQGACFHQRGATRRSRTAVQNACRQGNAGGGLPRS